MSQHEAAFLAGLYRGSSVSRFEESEREPNLEKALALEVIFGQSVRELFPDLYQKVEREVMARAKSLIYRMDWGQPGRGNDRKRQALSEIINPPSKSSTKHE